MKLNADAVETECKRPSDRGTLPACAALILTLLWAIYLFQYFHGVGISTLTGYVAASMVTPHMLCVWLAVVFGIIGLSKWVKWPMLTAGILLAVSAALMLTYAHMVILQAVLFFVAYARMD